MLYDIFYADRTMDRSTNLDIYGRAPRGAYALNLDWDGHVYVARRGKWVEGRRAADGKFVAADEIVVGDRVEAGIGDDREPGKVLAVAGKMATVAWDSGVRTPTPISDLTRI